MSKSSSIEYPDRFEVFYDGACVLCRKEMDMLKRWDKEHQIVFTDIAESNFLEYNDTKRSYDELMAEIHGRIVGQTVMKGVEVFRQLYGRLGWRRAVALSRLWGVRQICDLAYMVFAKNRLRLTGRCKDDVCRIK
jgi:predicted DCC family thiol-disulfide oxidoreductase YuxK